MKKNTLKIIYMYQLPPTPRIIIERLCTLQNYVFMCVLYDNRLLKIFFTWKKKQRCFSNDSMHVLFFFFANAIDYVTFTKNSFPLQSIYVKSYYLEYAKHPI